MNIKELYKDLTPTSRNIFTVLNTNLLNNLWTSGETPFATTDELTGLSNKLWVSNMEKIVSCMVENYCDLNDIDLSIITDNEWRTLLIMLFVEYKDKWVKLFENIAVKEYESVWNVDGTETITHTFEHGKTVTETKNLNDSTTYGKTETENRNLSDSTTYGKTETETKNLTHTMNKGSTDTTTVLSNVTQNSRNVFDSVTPVDTDKSSNTGSTTVTGSGYDSDVDTGTDTMTHSGTDSTSMTGTDTMVHSGIDSTSMTGMDTFRNTGVDTERTTNVRGGNIGITMTQQLLEAEYNFREKFNYFKIISEDIIHNLAYNIY